MYQKTAEWVSECTIGVLRHMQRYFSYTVYVTAQMCMRTEEEVVPTAE